MQRKPVLIAAVVIFLFGIAFAQSDTPAGGSPATDYAGRPTDPNVPRLPPPTPQQQQEVQQNAKDIHFDFDRADLRAEDRATLARTADWLKAHPGVFVTIKGDADERGSIVYNLALSDRRALAARDALIQMGVPADRIVFATGWGKLYPTCNQANESCWSQNRRAHFERW